MIPFNLRPLDRPLPRSLGNRFGLVIVTLPLSIADPFERLEAVHREMTRIKASPEPAVSFGVLTLIGMTAAAVEKRAVEFFAAKATGVITNVPGPTTPVSFGGARVTRVIGWGPRSGRQTLGIAMFSYNGEVVVGFVLDAKAVPNPRALIPAFAAEIEELGGSVGASSTPPQG